jgi:hypothetical protein
MARSYTHAQHFKTSTPFREAAPYHRVGAEVELSEEYARLLGRDPRPELGQYEATPIPKVRRKAVPPKGASEEQFDIGRAPSTRMIQRRTAKKSSHRKINPFMVTTGGQAVPQFKDQDPTTFHASGRHAQRHEEQGRRFRIQQTHSGVWEIVDARTGQPTGKYATSADRAQDVLAKMMRRTNPIELSRSTQRNLERAINLAANQFINETKRKRRKTNSNPSPVPGISVEEVIADVQGEEWANWDYNRAGIMHWR